MVEIKFLFLYTILVFTKDSRKREEI